MSNTSDRTLTVALAGDAMVTKRLSQIETRQQQLSNRLETVTIPIETLERFA